MGTIWEVFVKFHGNNFWITFFVKFYGNNLGATTNQRYNELCYKGTVLFINHDNCPWRSTHLYITCMHVQAYVLLNDVSVGTLFHIFYTHKVFLQCVLSNDVSHPKICRKLVDIFYKCISFLYSSGTNPRGLQLKQTSRISSVLFCLFGLWVNIPVNSYGHVEGMLRLSN